MTDFAFADIQGLVFSGYGERMLAASYHLLRIDHPDRAKTWLAGLLTRVTPASPPADGPRAFCLNVAFTRNGLELLGVPARSIDDTFEPAFQEGMTSERRIRILGDFDESAPKKWRWGGPNSPADAIVLLYAPNDAELKRREGWERTEWESHGLKEVVDPIVATPLNPTERFSREPFGFADGISQPTPVIADDARALDGFLKKDPEAVPGGEFLFGYKNAYWNEPLVPGRDLKRKDFGVNGSFLVARQFDQNVAGFWNFLLKLTNQDRVRAEWLAAKMVGRWPSGAVVRANQTTDPGLPATGENDFDYADDPRGLDVPIGSHIRRSNPRGTELADSKEISLMVARRHRILRRARSYGPPTVDRYHDDGERRGLFFLVLNANIERQFEFIMHSWMHNPVFGSLYQETDPLVGDPARIVDPVTFAPADKTAFSIPGSPVRERFQGIHRFATVVGGAYFFLPGLAALRRLANPAGIDA